jgi:hypothetical protein
MRIDQRLNSMGPSKMRRRVFRVLLLSLLTSGLIACGGADDPVPVMIVDADGVSTFNADGLATKLATYSVSAISTEEADSLAYMREEEQLAHDVYAVSTTLWDNPIFVNIAEAEATHSAAVKTLLDRYLLPDPLAGLPNGTFKTARFQALYDALVATSSISLIEALKVGVQIEELDMVDITEQAASVDNADILMVYDHLLRGSRNHLRAFMKVLIKEGGTYVPQYLTQAEFDAIVNSPVETGP